MSKNYPTMIGPCTLTTITPKTRASPSKKTQISTSSRFKSQGLKNSSCHKPISNPSCTRKSSSFKISSRQSKNDAMTGWVKKRKQLCSNVMKWWKLWTQCQDYRYLLPYFQGYVFASSQLFAIALVVFAKRLRDFTWRLISLESQSWSQDHRHRPFITGFTARKIRLIEEHRCL